MTGEPFVHLAENIKIDGISVAASIAGLVSLADTVFTRTYRYAKTVKHATKEISELATSVRDLSSLLHGLNLVLQELEDQAERSHLSNLAEFRLHHISSCLTTLTKIQKKLEKHHPDVLEQNSVKQALRSLKWPFSAADTKELLAEIEKHKAAINVALSGETFTAILKTLSRQGGVAADLKIMKDKQSERWAMEDHIRMDKDRKELLAFFGKIDPGSNHMLNLKLRHPLTGLWVTEGLIFREWLLNRNSKLWLSGIPGAGKTVIAASVIEEAMKESGEDRAVAYFYCDYQDKEKQTPLNILGSLASQLARQSEKAFSQLEELYRACHPRDKPSTSPDLQILGAKIRQMASCFDDVSIIVDGLDECGIHTSKVVELLISLASDENSNTRALFLSRDEGEIRGNLEKDYNHMEIAAQSEDLRLYVAAEMEARQQKHGRERLRIKSTSLKEHMMKTLVERADGMFRWVTCQLDFLCSLPNDAEKRKALSSLPPGLNATYERILERVNQNDESIQRMVQNTLQWIVSSSEVIPAVALCHAISIKDGDKAIDQEAFYDEEDILTHCSSLIRRSADGETLEMAHFTVKEFLSALDPDVRSPYSRYSQSTIFVFPQLAITCLTYITLECFRENLIENFDEWEKYHHSVYPFRRHAVKYWINYAQNSWENTRILELTMILFNPSATVCFLSWARDLLYYHYLDHDDDFFDISTYYFCAGGLKSLHIAASFGLIETCQWLIKSGSSVNDRSNVGTPLHCALLGMYRLSRTLLDEDWFSALVPFQYSKDSPRRMGVIKLLIENGADCNVLYRDRVGNEFSCSNLALYSDIGQGAEHPLVKLVAAGARVEKELLKDLDDEILDIILADCEFVEALIDGLKESNQEHAVRLQAALKLNNSSSFDLAKSHSARLSQANTEDLIDLFRSAVRFDQTQVMEELLRDRRLDVSFKDKSDGATFLHDAAERQSIGATRLLLSLGVNVNSTDIDNNTPLHLAMYGKLSERYEQCISLLLDYGANVNAVDCEGRTVWHDAARCSNSSDALRLLLAHCASQTQGLGVADEDGLTPLLIAAKDYDRPTCELLASPITYVHRFCPDGLSLVHYAVKMDSINLLQILQANNIKLTEKTRDGRTGLHFISNRTTLEIIHLFIDSGVDVNSSADNGETPLHILACMYPSPDAELFEPLFDMFATKESLNSKTVQGLTPLHYALHPPDNFSRPSPKHAEILIERGADVNICMADGTCYLGYLIAKHVRHLLTIKKGRNTSNSTMVDVNKSLEEAWSKFLFLGKLIITSTTNLELLTKLIDIPDANNFNWKIRPLNWFLAAPDAHELVELLLERKVNVDLLDSGHNSWSAIHTVCFQGASLPIFRRIFKMSRHNTEPDKLGNYPTHLTCLGKNLATSHAILEELCSSGFDPGLPTADEDAITPLMLAARNGKQKHFQILVNHGANIRAKDPLGWEAAHYAAANGHTLIIEQLLDFDIDWNLCMNNGGFNILHIAIMNDHYGLIAFILQRSLVDVLDYEGASGKSPLGFAIELGRIKSVQIILKVSSTNVNAFVARGNVRPIHLAAASGNLDVVRELLKYNCILLPNSSGMTPQLIALECGWKDVLRIIEEYDAQKSELPTPKVLTTTISRISLTKCHQTETGAITDQGALSINDQRLDMKVDVVTSSNSRDLQYAIEAGNLKLCKGLMEAGFNIHCTFKCGCTPLLVALTANKGEIARFLLQQGCSVQGVVPINCPMPGYSVVHLASIKSENVDFLKLLLGKHPSTISPAFQVPISPLHVAVGFKNTEALRVLLNHLNIQYLSNLRGNLDYRNSFTYLPGSEEMHENQDILGLQMPNSLLVFDPQIKRSEVEKFGGSEMPPFWCSGTPLHFAMYVDNFDAAKVLLRYGASANSINELGETPLHLVRKSGSLSIVRLLLDSGANPLSRDYEGRTPAMAAAAHSHVVPLKLILDRHKDFNSTDNFGWTLLHHAVRGGPKVFAFLLMQGCCPYSQNYLFNSPAILALWNYNNFSGFPALIFNLDLDYSKLNKALSQTKRTWINSDKSTVRRFLKRAPADAVRSELMAITWRNGSILGDAVQDGEESIVKLFVEAGADLELDRGLHGTPLLTACAFGRLLVVKYLVRAGAKIFSTKGGKPCSAVEAAGSFPEIIRWLLVERYTEQPRLELFTDGTEEVETCAWSGIHCVKVEAVGLYIQSAKDSIFDRAKRLAKLKRDLRGKVVNIFGSVD